MTKIAIIGGGIIGCLIGEQLRAQHSNAAITIFDSGLIGGGTSKWSAGVHFLFGKSEYVKELSSFSQNYYQQKLLSNKDFPIYPMKMLVGLSSMSHYTNQFIDCSQYDTQLASDTFLEWFPNKGFYDLPNCHVADVYNVAQMLRNELSNNGVEIFESVSITRIIESSSNVKLQTSIGHTLEFDYVILAPGPWVNDAPFREWTQHLDIKVKKIVALHIDSLPTLTGGIFCPDEDIFLVPFLHRGHWLLSYTCQQWDVHPTNCNRAGITTVEINEAETVLGQSFPFFKPKLSSGRVFCDAYSNNRAPIMTYVGSNKRIIFAGAANGAGYRLAPGIANEVCKLL